MAITDLKVSTSYIGRDISSLPDRPNEFGIGSATLKARFDQLGKEVIPNFNDLIDLLDAYITNNDNDIIALETAVDGLGIALGDLGISIQEVLDAYTSGELNGKSAYQVAVDEGFIGTESEWLASLVGSNGNGLIIKGQFATLIELQTAHPIGNEGDAWAVGDVDNSDLYLWDITDEEWKDIGQVGINMNGDSVLITDSGNYFISLNVEGALQEVGLALYNRYTKDESDALLEDKVDKVIGKGLSTEDYTSTEKTKLSGIAESANNYVHPTTHAPSIIEQDANNRFVTDAEKTAWNAKATYTVYTATIPNTSWTGSSAPYSKAVTVTGLLSTDEPIIDLVLSGTYATDVTMRENWSKIYRGVTSADSITFYADSIPSANISIQLVVVR